MSAQGRPTLWFDVEDLFVYALTESRPSGIQRLAFEAHRALAMDPALSGRVRFVRHHAALAQFVEVGWEEVLATFRALSRPVQRAPAEEKDQDAGPRQGLRGAAGRLVTPELKVALGRFIGALLAAKRALPPVLQALAHNLRHGPPRASGDPFGAAAAPLPEGGRSPFSPGDVLACLGSTWFDAAYATRVRVARERGGVRFAVLIYDIIPIRHPEWCAHALVQAFRRWMASVLPLTDLALAISRASAVDLERYAAEQGVRLRAPVRAIPIGSGFTDLHPRAPSEPAAPLVDGDYALIVSTVEARKNHALLFRIWRRLLEDLPAERVPTLVFAGRIGWLVADLMQQLKNADHLGGKIVVIEEPSDVELEGLYRGCLFSLFPSLYEGWGLPVTESLMFGKPCLLSNRTSLPEAGGEFGRYFDPENLEEAYGVVHRTIEDRDGLAAWEADIRARFRPTPWSETARAIAAAALGSG